MNTTSQIIATLKHWNATQPQIRTNLMNDYRGLAPVKSIELRIQSEQAMRALLDLETYALFLTLATKDALK